MFSALGFYPVCPASDEYAIGTPYFKKAVVHLKDGKEIVIDAGNNSCCTPYISKMTFNGKAHDSNFLSHSELVKGAEIDFTMSSEPALR